VGREFRRCTDGNGGISDVWLVGLGVVWNFAISEVGPWVAGNFGGGAGPGAICSLRLYSLQPEPQPVRLSRLLALQVPTPQL